METKITHAWEIKMYTKWKTSHEETAPQQDILQMDDAQNGETPKTRVEHTELNKILEKLNVQMVTSAFLQCTMAITTPLKIRTCLGVKTQVEKYQKTNEITTTEANMGVFQHRHKPGFYGPLPTGKTPTRSRQRRVRHDKGRKAGEWVSREILSPEKGSAWGHGPKTLLPNGKL